MQGFETLSDAYWTMSGLVVLMTLVGGMGTLFGPLLGAALIVALEDRLGDIGSALASTTGVEWFRSLGESVTIVTGVIFIAVRARVPARDRGRDHRARAAVARLSGAVRLQCIELLRHPI